MGNWLARGVGNGMISVANQMYKESNAQLDSDLQMQRQAMLEEFRQKNMDKVEAIKNAPYDRANAAIKNAQGKEVPVAPEEVTSLKGDESSDRSGKGGLIGSYQGDTKNIVNDISKIKSDDDKRMAADALESQLQDAKARNIAAAEGKTRKLSEDEIMQEARKSLMGDIQATKALKEGEREKYTKIGKDDTLLDAKGNVVYKNNSGEEQMRTKLENAKEIAQMRIDAITAAHNGKASDKVISHLAINSIDRDIKDNQFMYNKAHDDYKEAVKNIDDAGKAEAKKSMAALESDKLSLKAQRSAMFKQFGIDMPESTSAKQPEEKPAAQQNNAVTFNGKPVDYNSLKSGDKYTSPDGKMRIKK